MQRDLHCIRSLQKKKEQVLIVKPCGHKLVVFTNTQQHNKTKKNAYFQGLARFYSVFSQTQNLTFVLPTRGLKNIFICGSFVTVRNPCLACTQQWKKNQLIPCYNTCYGLIFLVLCTIITHSITREVNSKNTKVLVWF